MVQAVAGRLNLVGEDQRHLVLGGTRGIGLAYAKWFACRGDRLTLIARNAEDAGQARQLMLELGSSDVDVICCDLADSVQRMELLERLDSGIFDWVYVGGPTPPAGLLDSLSEEQLSFAAEVCVAYPASIFKWASRQSNANHMRLVVVSSAAIFKPLEKNPFAASALFRSCLEKVVGFYQSRFARLDVWYPELVWTPLAEAYAEQIFPGVTEERKKKMLAERLGTPNVDDVDEFVAERLEGA